MTVTDFAGVLGLIAAALLALWMLLGAGPLPHLPHLPHRLAARPAARRAAPSSAPGPGPGSGFSPRPARHRADSGRLLRFLR